MNRYIFIMLGKKFLLLLALLLFISFLSFVLMEISPIDAVAAFGRVRSVGITPEKRAMLEKEWGLDRSFGERYVIWLKNAVRLNFGMSTIYERPVIDIIAEGFGASGLLMLIAWCLQGLLGFLFGVVAGVRKGKVSDVLIKIYCIILAAAPTFWIGIMLLLLFAIKLKIFPVSMSSPIGVVTSDISIWQKIHHMILPAITLAIVGVSSIAMHTREKVIGELKSDYILFARARGIKGFDLIKKVGLKNVIMPALMLQFTYFSELFGGAVLAENVFNYPGLGKYTVEAGLRGDIPLLLGIAMFSTVFVFVGNFIADIIAVIIDPRIRKGGVLTDEGI